MTYIDVDSDASTFTHLLRNLVCKRVLVCCGLGCIGLAILH
jgi:hypothetical protein